MTMSSNIGTRTPRWVWRNPAQSSAWMARMAALLLAIPCMANVLLVKVAFDKGYFQWTISAIALVSSVILLHRGISGRQSHVAEYGALLATGMWAANTMEIALADFVSPEGKIRNGGFYFGYAMLTGLFYLAERVGYRTNDAPVTKAVEIVDHVVDQVGSSAQVVSVVDQIDAQLVADVVIEETDTLTSNENGHQNGSG
jgi:hypothetical protein